MVIAFLAGMATLVSDRLDGMRLLRLLDGAGVWPTKYNRGIDYFMLILLPVLGYAAARRLPRDAACLAVAAVLTVAAGRNTTAQIALPVAVGAAVMAALAPRLAAVALAALTATVALTLPFVLRLLTQARPLIAPHIKISGLERLEIWDYLSAHVLQRPFAGWGLWTSRPASRLPRRSGRIT